MRIAFQIILFLFFPFALICSESQEDVSTARIHKHRHERHDEGATDISRLEPILSSESEPLTLYQSQKIKSYFSCVKAAEI